MKKRKYINLFVSIILLVLCFFIIIHWYGERKKLNFSSKIGDFTKSDNEFQPEEEINENDNFNTNVKLFLVDPSSQVLVSENVNVDARKLLDNPYKYIINLLINPPSEIKLKSAMADGTKINNCVFDKGILTVDFNEKFLNSIGSNAIYSVVNTLAEFNEIDAIKIKINGEENEQLKDKFVKVN